jgi:hypothetical protein
MDGKLRAAFWGGLFTGVLTALPFVKYLNACCCLWVISGGLIAVYVAQSNQRETIKAADGVFVGLLAGLIGALISFPINLMYEAWERGMILRFIDNMGAEVPGELRDVLDNASGSPIRQIAGLFFSMVAYSVFGMLGGLLGVAIFKKTPPPPPPGTVEILPPQ